MPNNVLIKRFYDNIKFLSPNGEFLFYNSTKKANWYLKKGLAEIVVESPLTLRLTFEPNGKGTVNDNHLSSIQVNKCVVCGVNKNLTRHHVIPLMFKRHFPTEIANHNAYDVFMVCSDCHCKYEEYANFFKRKIVERLRPKVPRPPLSFFEERSVLQAVAAIANHLDVIPEETKNKYMDRIIEYFDRFLTLEQIKSIYVNMSEDKPREIYDRTYLSNYISSFDIEKLKDFIIMWRKHFIQTMKPKHLPPYWDINKTFGVEL